MKNLNKSKDSIESTWVKLESVFDTSSLKSSGRLLPHHRKANISMSIQRTANRSINRSPTDSPDPYANRSATPLLSYTRPTITIEGLSQLQLKQLYNAKCQDLNIPVLPDQQFRFFSFCYKHFSKRKFEMQESGLGEASATAIGEILVENFCFSYINLGKNMLGDVGCLKLVKLLQRNIGIVHLDISSNNISPEGAEEILKTVSTHHSLASIDISSHEGLHRNRLCSLGAIGMNYLLTRSLVISYINVFGTSIGEGIDQMFKGIELSKSLISLNIGSNGIGGEFMKGLMSSLDNTNLLQLNISINSIGNDGCENIAKFLGKNPSLEKLDISSNYISTKGIRKIFDSLSNNSHLISLNLENNPLQNGLSDDFVYFATTNTTIEEVNLSNCTLKSEGVLILAEGISKNRSIKSVKLGFNSIGDSGIEGLAIAITRNASILELDLSNNRIKDQGAIFLANGLKSNCSMQDINLKANCIKDNGGNALCDVVRTHSNIIKLCLDLNQINSKCLAIIKENLKINYEKFKKAIPNKIKKQTENINYDENAIQNIMQKIQQKKKEKEEIKQRIEKNVEKFEEIKQSEAERLKALQETLSELKTKNQELSVTLDSIQGLVFKSRIKYEKEINSLKEKIDIIDIEIIKNEKRSKNYLGNQLKDEILLKKSKTQNINTQFIEMLKSEDLIKKNTENTLAYLKKKIVENKETIKKIKNPGMQRNEENKFSSREKNFLASEKLANTKKQGYLGPNQIPEFPKKKRLKTKSQ